MIGRTRSYIEASYSFTMQVPSQQLDLAGCNFDVGLFMASSLISEKVVAKSTDLKRVANNNFLMVLSGI